MCQTLNILSSSSQPRMSQNSTTSASTFGRRIIFFGAAEDVNEPTLLQLFSQHGDVTGLFLVRSALGLPSGCGYVTLGTADQASAAVAALQGSSECAEPGGKLGLLVVQPAEGWSNPDSAQDDSSSATHTSKDSRTVFFTKVPPTVTAHQLIQLFTACGEVLHVELFTPWPGAKISKGCGLVEFAHADAAAAAVNSLHQHFTWPHSHSPLVVEWVDAKRQAANRANKLNKASSEAAAASAAVAAGPIRRALTVPMDRDAILAARGLYSTSLGQQQQLNSRSCPLPRIQASWAQPAPWMSPNTAPQGVFLQQSSAVLPQQQQQQQGSDGSYYNLQRQPSNASTSGTYWWPVQQCSSGMASTCLSSYENSSSLALSGLTNISHTSTVMPLGPNDMSANSLPGANCSISAAGADVQYCDVGYNQSGCQSPVSSEPMLSMATAAGLSAGRVEPAWQQLQQQNVMLLQPLSSPSEEQQVPGSNRVLLQNTSTGFVAERQQQLGRVCVSGAMHGANIPASNGMMLQQQPPAQSLQQYQVCYAPASAAMQQAAFYQQQQQAGSRQLQQQQGMAGNQLWVQQPQHVASADKKSVMVLSLSPRQLQVMASVLPEVPRLTGAQAYLAAGSVGGVVELMLTGHAIEVQSAHSVVAMLLQKMGVDEPLLQAMQQQAAH